MKGWERAKLVPLRPTHQLSVDKEGGYWWWGGGGGGDGMEKCPTPEDPVRLWPVP